MLVSLPLYLLIGGLGAEPPENIFGSGAPSAVIVEG